MYFFYEFIGIDFNEMQIIKIIALKNQSNREGYYESFNITL